MVIEIIAAVLVLLLLGVILFYALACINLFRFLRPFYCKVLPWHSGSYEITGHDGCSAHARCRWCGYEGMIDSQGNLF